MGLVRTALAGAAAAGLGVALWWRRNPSACPYSQRFWIEAPHLFITRERLRQALEPRPGEHLLEVGPGTGYYTLTAAEWIGPEGTLDILDVQREMLDHTMRRAREAGIGNLRPAEGDARSMPYDDDSFDGAFLVTVLGEVPGQDAAVRELSRVVRPGGRVVFGEVIGDPHYVRFPRLCERAADAGMELDRRVGNALGYFARFTVTAQTARAAA